MLRLAPSRPPGDLAGPRHGVGWVKYGTGVKFSCRVLLVTGKNVTPVGELAGPHHGVGWVKYAQRVFRVPVSLSCVA